MFLFLPPSLVCFIFFLYSSITISFLSLSRSRSSLALSSPVSFSLFVSLSSHPLSLSLSFSLCVSLHSNPRMLVRMCESSCNNGTIIKLLWSVAPNFFVEMFLGLSSFSSHLQAFISFGISSQLGSFKKISF